MKKIIIISSFLMSTFALANDTPTITVSANGTISIKPDTVSIIATVETINEKSDVAVNENISIIDKTTKLIKNLGINEKDIKTENYTLNYRENYNSKSNEMKYYAKNQIFITTNDLEKTSQILSALNEGGVNNIGTVNFYASNKEKFENEAYKLAYENAKEKAQLIASIDNFKISPKSIDLNPTPSLLPFMYGANTRAESLAIPITIPNNIDITTSINVTFYMEK